MTHATFCYSITVTSTTTVYKADLPPGVAPQLPAHHGVKAVPVELVSLAQVLAVFRQHVKIVARLFEPEGEGEGEDGRRESKWCTHAVVRERRQRRRA